MTGFKDHDLRYAMANELHARPFPRATAPGRAVYLVIKAPGKASQRDRDTDRKHLTDEPQVRTELSHTIHFLLDASQCHDNQTSG